MKLMPIPDFYKRQIETVLSTFTTDAGYGEPHINKKTGYLVVKGFDFDDGSRPFVLRIETRGGNRRVVLVPCDNVVQADVMFEVLKRFKDDTSSTSLDQLDVPPTTGSGDSLSSEMAGG
jgi:hypothetical protein